MKKLDQWVLAFLLSATGFAVAQQRDPAQPIAGVADGKAVASQAGPEENTKPQIVSTEFGSITIGTRVYQHDVVIRLDGKVEKRKKKLSKQDAGTSHIVSLDEARHVYQAGAVRLIVGTGQSGMVKLSDEAADYFKRKACAVELLPTPAAVQAWNRAKGAVIGLFHVTC